MNRQTRTPSEELLGKEKDEEEEEEREKEKENAKLSLLLLLEKCAEVGGTKRNGEEEEAENVEEGAEAFDCEEELELICDLSMCG